MKTIIFSLLVFYSAFAFGQKYIQVKEECNPDDIHKDLSITIINKSTEGIMFIINITTPIPKVFFLVDFFDEDGQRLKFVHTDYPYFPFVRGLKREHLLQIEPNGSTTFNYPLRSIVRYCQEPEQVKKIKIDYLIPYQIRKESFIGELIEREVYRGSSDFISIDF
ncbi:MAG: hypothetical protein LBR67_07025 [Dysgonamonadaceae bacterium]|jgi:hypothetical protein|nr:hypothetical protein [Dysgonamonadaceae bacterium]